MKEQEKTQYKAQGKKKSLLIMLMLMLIISTLSLVFATAIVSAENPAYLPDNQEESGEATSYKAIYTEGLLYPKIELYEWRFLTLGNKIAEVELVENSDKCIIDCYAIMKITLYKNKKNFFNDVIFKQKIGYNDPQYTDNKYDYKLLLKQITNKKIWRENKYYDCSKWFEKEEKKLGENDTMPIPIQEKDCDLITGEIEDNITEESWEEYQPDRVLQHGVYYFKLTGQKKSYESVDWIPELFNYPIEELAWWNASDPFGTGSLGNVVFTTTTKSYGNMVLNVDYQVSGNTLYLYTNRVYNFNNFELGAGTILTTQNTSGVAMYIAVLNEAKIQGSVNLNNIHSRGDSAETWSIYGNSISLPNVANGGNGGNGGWVERDGGGDTGFGGTGSSGNSLGFGGNGGGGATYANGLEDDGGNAGSAYNGVGSPVYGVGASVEGGDEGATGGAGGNGGGGGGSATIEDADSTEGADGGDGWGQGGSVNSAESGEAFSAGGGGSSDAYGAGISGFHFYLASSTINFTGVITTSGTNGISGSGGSGDTDNGDPSDDACAGGGGGSGGGGGGSAGNISFVYETLYDTGTKTMNAGSGGAGGSNGANEEDGTNCDAWTGSASTGGASGSGGTFQTDQLDLGIEIVLNSPSDGLSVNINEEVTFNCSSDVSGGKNITNITLYIDEVPEYTFNNTGISYEWCYQESANTTNQTGIDGNCGLNYSGSYSLLQVGLPAGTSYTDYDINYTKPSNATNANFTFLIGNSTSSTQNIAIPDSCFNYNFTTLFIRIRPFAIGFGVTSNTSVSCYNGTWIELYSLTGGTGVFTQNNSKMWDWIDGNWTTYTASYNADGKYGTMNDPMVTRVYEEAINWNISRISGGGNAELIYTKNITAYGTYFWTCDAYDSDGNYNIASERYFIVRNYEFETEAHNNETYETQKEDYYSIGITYNQSLFSDINSYFSYDGNIYPSTKQLYNGTANFYASINIPLVSAGESENKTFYWIFQFTDISSGNRFNVTSDIYQQLVHRIHLQICNATYNVSALNFTIKDELNFSEVNASLQATFLQYYISDGDGSVSRNYSYQNLAENQSRYSFCISPSDRSYKANMLASYEATGYAPRVKYLVGATLNNVTNSQILYLLDDTTAVKFFISVYNSGFPVQSGYITITKYMIGTGTYETIGVRQTDSTGKFIEYLELDELYRFAISDSSGNFLGTIERRAICEATPCEITLELATESLEDRPDTTYDSYYDMYGTNVSYSLNYNKTSKMVDFIFTDLAGTAQYFRLKAYYLSGNISGGTICDTYVYSTSGSIACNLTNIYGDIRVDTFISRSPEKFLETLFIALSQLGEALGSDGIVIALILIITMSLIGVWNPPVGIVLTILACLALKIMGILSISMATISVLFILGIIIIWKMKS